MVIEHVEPHRSKTVQLEMYSATRESPPKTAESGFDAEHSLADSRLFKDHGHKNYSHPALIGFFAKAEKARHAPGPTHHSVVTKKATWRIATTWSALCDCPGACLRTGHHRGD